MNTFTHNSLGKIAVSGILFSLFAFSTNAENIVVKVKGSKANGDFAHFHLLVNDLEVGSKNTSCVFEEYCFQTPFSGEEINEIKILYDNDFSLGKEDRNLYISSLTIENQPPFNAVTGIVKYYLQNGKEEEFNGVMGRNGVLVLNVNTVNQCPDNVTLKSQSEVNAFKCQCIKGSLTISGEDITDLSPLAVVTSISGPLNIKNNPRLEVVGGMDSLIEIAFLSITGNPKLERIDGFNSMQKCGGIYVSDNNSLKTIKCFHTPNL
jgi:hypothetical protein